MIFMTNVKTICAKCSATGRLTDFQVPAITFNFLRGYPSLCERCVAKLFGVDRDWHPDVSDLIICEEKTA